METQIGSEQMRYTVWTVKNLNQIPIEYEQNMNRIWTDSLNKAYVIFLFLWTQTKENIFIYFFQFGLVWSGPTNILLHF